MPSNQAHDTSIRRGLWPCAALCLIAALHARTLGFGFLAWDDPLHVTANPLVIAAGHASWLDHLLTPALGYPIPVTVLTYSLQAIGGLQQAWAFHLVNVLVHVSVCGLVACLALRAGLTPIAATLACLLVGLHPVVAEPVSWVSGRKDLLAALFGLLAVHCAWPVPRPRSWHVPAAISCYALGLLSKPALAGLSVLLPVAQLWFAPADTKNTRRNALLTALGCVALLLPITYLAVHGQRNVGALVDGERGAASQLRSIWYALGHHLDLLFLWQEPSAKYLPTPWPPGFSPRVDLAPLLAAAAALASLLLPKDLRRCAGFGIVWAVLAYLPSSNLLPLARYLADSYVYLPLIGCGLWLGAVADGLSRSLDPARARLTWLAPLLLSATLAPLLWMSSGRFSNDERLWAQALSVYPQSAHICRQWANGVSLVRGPGPGLIATDFCIERFGPKLFEKNRGILLAQLGRRAEAEQWLRRAQLAHPEDSTLQRYLAALAKQTEGPSTAPTATHSTGF